MVVRTGDAAARASYCHYRANIGGRVATILWGRPRFQDLYLGQRGCHQPLAGENMQFDIDMKSEHKELFMLARELLVEHYRLQETKKDRITTYSDDISGICHLRTMRHGIDIGFLKGVRLEDKYGLLTGTGKVMRVLSMQVLDVDHVKYYMGQAIKINAESI
jgi:hypothetical protein